VTDVEATKASWTKEYHNITWWPSHTGPVIWIFLSFGSRIYIANHRGSPKTLQGMNSLLLRRPRYFRGLFQDNCLLQEMNYVHKSSLIDHINVRRHFEVRDNIAKFCYDKIKLKLHVFSELTLSHFHIWMCLMFIYYKHIYICWHIADHISDITLHSR
jgi:hypothetical protein